MQKHKQKLPKINPICESRLMDLDRLLHSLTRPTSVPSLTAPLAPLLRGLRRQGGGKARTGPSGAGNRGIGVVVNLWGERARHVRRGGWGRGEQARGLATGAGRAPPAYVQAGQDQQDEDRRAQHVRADLQDPSRLASPAHGAAPRPQPAARAGRGQPAVEVAGGARTVGVSQQSTNLRCAAPCAGTP